LDKTIKAHDHLRLSLLLFYFVNASSVLLTTDEFKILLSYTKGHFSIKMVGLYAIERLIRVDSTLVNVENVNKLYNILIDST